MYVDEKATAGVTRPQEPEAASFSQRIGSTVYSVNVHFSESNRETLQDKMMRLIQNDLVNEPNPPQTGTRSADMQGRLSERNIA